MSIRIKLIISYLIMIVLPIGLMVLFLHMLFHLFVGNLEEMKEYYTIEDNFIDELLTEDLFIYTSLEKQIKENPDLFRDPSFFTGYQALLDKRQATLIVTDDNDLIYSSQPVANDSLSNLTSSRYNQGFLRTDEGTWLYTSTDFYYSDNIDGAYFLLLDIKPIDSFVRIIVPTLVGTFLLAFLIANGILTYIMSKHIIQPLHKLKDAADKIKEGELQSPIELTRQDEIGELSDALEQMRLKLLDSVEKQAKYEWNRKELVNNISHDLKTPITSIKGYVEGILDGIANDREKLEKYCHTIYTKADHMDQLIDELLLFSKLDLNSVSFHFEKTNILTFVQSLIEEIRLDVEQTTIEVQIENKLSSHAYVLADHDKLGRAFRNILTNSLKYLDKQQKKMIITLDNYHESILITVEDNGQGIKETDLPRIFERFYRGDTARNSANGGSGIGLAIVKQIIEAHGGTINVKSTYGEGTAFYITLNSIEKSVKEDDEDFNY
ncbi:HAMP domain-containing sensor histidine kinase [Gracilibacillus sp. S3-1-1]|uniref:HAMP domain-containing sensor histidine kinase n=1 Tax=Gracilibacillus pellucidus TaxID=3095368 RepID=A0ACC6M3X1_9BACI|nr:HAMP domain-containing sensor histidine kinase [Gracilibacillus sp. S3-1-1]MDX8045586.1 HAMP domain-containing sensor histidine kinase [Gracilibacillus sp. S3-1-1]